MHETPRQHNFLRVLTAALAFSMGKTAVANFEAAQQPTQPWVNVSFVLPKVPAAAEQTVIAENLRPWQQTYVPNLVPLAAWITAEKAATASTMSTPPPTTTSSAEAPSNVDGPSGPWLPAAMCEEGGKNDTSKGYLGFQYNTWLAYGGTDFAPLPGGATWSQQVSVAYRIQSSPPTWPGEPSCAEYKGW